MGMVTGQISAETHFLASLDIFHHVLIRFIGRIDACLSALYWEGKRIHDNYGFTHHFPLHETHDLMRHTRACVNDLDLDCLSELEEPRFKPKDLPS